MSTCITPGYQFNSDPTCREIDGRFYLFATQDPFTEQFRTFNEKFKGMFNYRAYSTVNFDDWVDHGVLLNSRSTDWHAGTAVWDGDAGIPANGRFYAYVPFRRNPDGEDNHGYFEIGVLEAERPEGPYRDCLGTPMQHPHGGALKGLSPTVVHDDNDVPHLLWGGGDWKAHHVQIAELDPSMTRLASEPREIRVQTITEAGGLEYYESPILFKRGDTWYLTYIAFKDYGGRNLNFDESDPQGCYVRYCTSDSMFGPFDETPRTLVHGSEINTQQGVCTYRGQWILAYHRVTPRVEGIPGIHRRVCVTALEFDADGTPLTVYPEHDPGLGTAGVSRLTLDAYAPCRPATDFHERRGAHEVEVAFGEYEFAMRTGDFLRFNRVDFGAGPSSVRAELAPLTERGIDAQLQFRIDTPDGPLVGELPATVSGDAAEGDTEPVTGIHDLFVVAAGDTADAPLFRLRAFRFQGR